MCGTRARELFGSIREALERYLVQSHGLIQALALVPPAAVPLVCCVVQQYVQSLSLTQGTLQHPRRSPQEILHVRGRKCAGILPSFVNTPLVEKCRTGCSSVSVSISSLHPPLKYCFPHPRQKQACGHVSSMLTVGFEAPPSHQEPSIHACLSYIKTNRRATGAGPAMHRYDQPCSTQRLMKRLPGSGRFAQSLFYPPPKEAALRCWAESWARRPFLHSHLLAPCPTLTQALTPRFDCRA